MEDKVLVIHLTATTVPMIGKATDDCVDGVQILRVEDPLWMVYYRDDEGEERMQLTNVTAYAKEDVIAIDRSHIVYMYEPKDFILGYYNDTMTKRLEPVTND